MLCVVTKSHEKEKKSEDFYILKIPDETLKENK